jgi:hypothetical protein
MATKTWASTAVALFAIAALTACSGSAGGTDTPATTPPAAGSDALGGAPPAAVTGAPTSRSAQAPATTAKPSAAKALTCDRLKSAELSSASAKELGYPERVQLVNGAWSGSGLSVSSRECGIGDLNGDGTADGLASVVFNNGGTGQFYWLAFWRNVAGEPVFTAMHELDDRTPVEKITIAGGKATVVILTRTPDQPAAAVNIRRTAIYTVSGSTLAEQSHTDAAYQP